MSQDPLDYQVLLQDALRGLVRRSLEIVADQGFTGDHHLYLSFRTTSPGVGIPPHMLESYPDEMTIVLKTQFKDLTVTEEEFSVGLFFGGVLYYLTVPFTAMVTFSDPSVGFQLVFPSTSEEEGLAAVPDGTEEADGTEETDGTEEAGGKEEAGGDPEAPEPAADNVIAFSGFRKKS